VRLHAYNFLDQKLISSERFQANYSLGSVTEAIHEIVEIIQLTLVRKDVVVATDMTFIDDFYPSFLYDRRRLQQVLFALMLNATTYQTEGQKIRVVATIDYDGDNDQEFQLCVSVTHEGHEMSAEEIESQFDFGYDSNIIDGQNNFNSLSICKQICQSLRGDIKAVSKPNVGTCFTFTMQVLNDGLDYDRPIQVELEPDSVRSKKRISDTNDIELLEDDEKANLNVEGLHHSGNLHSNDSRNSRDFQHQVDNRLKESMI